MTDKRFIFGLVAGVFIAGCAGAKFPYKYYALDAISYEGFLRGPEPKDDLGLEICKPTDSDKAPCLVMRTSDVLKLKAEYLNVQDELKRCQQDQ